MKEIVAPDRCNEAAWVEFHENIKGGTPRQPTSFRVWHDTSALRVEFAVFDDHLAATQTKRDGPIWEEEVVEMFLDPVGDLEAYYEIEINPLGTVTDLVLRRNRNGWRKDFEWNCEGLTAEVEITPSGWNCRAGIPFEAVGVPPGSNGVWRANFMRIDRPKGISRELSAWIPTRAGTFHVPEAFGSIRFL